MIPQFELWRSSTELKILTPGRKTGVISQVQRGNFGLPKFGPRSETSGHRQSHPLNERVVVLQLRHQGLGNGFGNQSEGDTVSSPLLLLKRNLLNTNLKDKSGYCACAVTAFPRNLNGILFLFFFLITYLNTYLHNSGFSLLGGGEGRH